jgi:hypothetical protein
MSTAAISPATLPSPSADEGHASISRIYVLETKYEFLKPLRLPHYLVGTLGFQSVLRALRREPCAEIRRLSALPGAPLASYRISAPSRRRLRIRRRSGRGARAGLDDAEARDAHAAVSAYLGAKIIASLCFGTITPGS